MRLLYATRLFSGLEAGLLRGEWAPAGVPTIYKMMETLDRRPDEVRFVLTCKDNEGRGDSAWSESRDRTLRLPGLSRPLLVLAGDSFFGAWPRPVRRYLRELRHLWRLWREARTFRPDVIYIDHANTWSAGLLARVLATPVVLRVMGISGMRMSAEGRGLARRILRWCYRAPYALVVCSQDGSGAERWLAALLAPGVRREILINGVTPAARPSAADPRLVALPSGRVIVLFVARLEPDKGCETFVRAMLMLHRGHGRRVHAVVVGEGSRRAVLQAMVEEAGAQDLVSFVGHLPHEQIVEAHARSDIYVSLNRFGNLSNANLEAMSWGDCMIIPASQPERGIDLITDELVPADAVVRVPGDDPAALAQAVARLSEDAWERERLGAAVRAAAGRFVQSWDQRVQREIALLRALCAVDLQSSQSGEGQAS